MEVLCPSLSKQAQLGKMSDITPQTNTPYPEPPAKKRNDLAIELIAGSVGGATQVLIGQVSPLGILERHYIDVESLWTH